MPAEVVHYKNPACGKENNKDKQESHGDKIVGLEDEQESHEDKMVRLEDKQDKIVGLEDKEESLVDQLVGLEDKQEDSNDVTSEESVNNGGSTADGSRGATVTSYMFEGFEDEFSSQM